MDALVVQDLTKTYRIGVGRARVREMLPWPTDKAVRSLFPKWWIRNTFNALEDVSFSVPAGSSLGVVGHNGAGKTTLLRLIAGITSPSRGSVTVNGRVGALIDVLVGFHPELTGRENVYLLGAMYGYGRKDMNDRLDSILGFAEIDELTDTPLKRYSAGMGARLGFGTLTTLAPDALLIDEVLAVGDAAFQRKCVGWLEEYVADGGTLVFVSHNLSMVRSMTDRSVWLDHGKLMADGPTAQIVAHYARAMERRDVDPKGLRRSQVRKLVKSRGTHRWGLGGARVGEVHVDEDRMVDEGLRVSITYEASEVSDAIFCVGLLDDSGRELGSASSAPVRLEASGGNVRCVIHPLPLRSGIYFPVVAILSPDGRVRDRWRLDRAIVVDGNGETELASEFGPVHLTGKWSHADS